MVDRSPAQGCCSSTDLPATLAERAELGHRRLTALRQIAAGSSVALVVAALLVYFQLVPIEAQVSGRLAIGAALVGVPRLLGQLRKALTARRPTPQAALGLALAVAALAGLALPVAIAVAIVLVGDLRPQARRGEATPVARPAVHLSRTL